MAACWAPRKDRMPLHPNDPSIPTVGQPADVIFWYPTVLLRCKCQPERLNILILTGIRNPVTCGSCHTVYTTMGFQEGPAGLVPVIDFRPGVAGSERPQ